jgi:DNA-binding transcriptional MerR regulator
VSVTGIAAPQRDSELTVDELARQADLPVRTIREYQTLGLVPPPARRGRVGMYRAHHVDRLALIRRLQARGYSLAGIGDLLESWRDGGDLGEVLGLTADQLVHVEEPGAPATLTELARVAPDLVPERLDDLLAVGVVEECDAGEYCVPSPSLLQLARDATSAGYETDTVIEFLGAIKHATDAVADAAVAALAARPARAEPDDLVAFATRARGLLAHGTGRLTINALGKRLGIADDAAVTDGLRRLLEVEDR